MISLVDLDVTDVAASAAAAIRARTPGLCATIALFPSHGDGKCPQGCQIVLQPACKAPRGELLRIDDHLFHGDTARRAFIDQLDRRLKPLVEGIGYRVVADEASNGVVVFPVEPRDDLGPSHSASSTASSAQT